MNETFKKLLNNAFLKELSFRIVNFPLLNLAYKKAYKKNIDKKLKDFKISGLIITIEPSNVCNSKCVMCPYQKMTRPKEVMSMDLFKKIVDDCVCLGIEKFNLNFYNEPFMDPFIFERMKYLKSKNVHTQLFSNGSVLDGRKINDIIESGLDTINFSVDGAKKETYEKIRKGLNFEKTVSNVLNLIKRKKELKSEKPKVGVVFVRQKLNAKEVGDFKKFWTGKADKIIISSDDNRNETANFSVGGKTAFPCRRLWTEVVAMSNGQVALCCIDSDGEVILGDFKNQTMMEIWEGEKFKNIRKLHLDFLANKIPLCKKCAHPYRMNLRSWWD